MWRVEGVVVSGPVADVLSSAAHESGVLGLGRWYWELRLHRRPAARLRNCPSCRGRDAGSDPAQITACAGGCEIRWSSQGRVAVVKMWCRWGVEVVIEDLAILNA